MHRWEALQRAQYLLTTGARSNRWRTCCTTTRWTCNCSEVAPRGSSLLGMAVSDDPNPVGLTATEWALALLTWGTVDETPLQRPSMATLKPAEAASPPRPSAPKPTQDTHLLKLTQDILTSRAWDARQLLGMA